MELQYISDAAGKHTAVVIPIEDWEKLTDKYTVLKDIERKPNNFKPSDFVGIISEEVADAMQEYIRESRKSWG